MKRGPHVDPGDPRSTRRWSLHVAPTSQHNVSLIRLETKEAEMAKAKSPIPEGFHTVTPQLTLDNAAQTIEWYK